MHHQSHPQHHVRNDDRTANDREHNNRRDAQALFLKLGRLHQLIVAALDAAFALDAVFFPLKRDELVLNTEALATAALKLTTA